MIANGVLISGIAGGDRTARGFVDGYDPETGKQLWRRWTVPSPGEPGSETWPNKDMPDAWKYGGGAPWQPATYDPEMDLVFVGTGNAEPWVQKFRGAQGVVVTRVAANSTAAEQGIRAGDVIEKVDNATVTSPSEVAAKIDAARKGDKPAVLLLVNRRGASQFVALKTSQA